MSKRKQALGRGLDALLAKPRTSAHAFDAVATPPTVSQAVEKAAEETQPGQLKRLPLEKIRPNPRQPRRNFDPEALDQLADSIREHGVLQPILVAIGDHAEDYILLAGERRLRASDIPARVIEASDVERLEFALIENVQREDLDPVEEARAYQQLVTSFGYSQEQVAKRVGKSRVAVANALRLLKLSEHCLQDLSEGLLSSGHARAILMLPHPLQQEELRSEIIERSLSVREAESRAKEMLTGETASPTEPKKPKKSATEPQQDLDVLDLQEKVTLRLGCKARIKTKNATSGTLEIAYQNLDDLDRILEIMGVDVDRD